MTKQEHCYYGYQKPTWSEIYLHLMTEKAAHKALQDTTERKNTEAEFCWEKALLVFYFYRRKKMQKVSIVGRMGEADEGTHFCCIRLSAKRFENLLQSPVTTKLSPVYASELLSIDFPFVTVEESTFNWRLNSTASAT